MIALKEKRALNYNDLVLKSQKLTQDYKGYEIEYIAFIYKRCLMLLMMLQMIFAEINYKYSSKHKTYFKHIFRILFV